MMARQMFDVPPAGEGELLVTRLSPLAENDVPTLRELHKEAQSVPISTHSWAGYTPTRCEEALVATCILVVRSVFRGKWDDYLGRPFPLG